MSVVGDPGRCPVCTMVIPAAASPDPAHTGLVRLVLHTHPLVVHQSDLMGDRDLLMPCIGTHADVRPYAGTVPPGSYAGTP